MKYSGKGRHIGLATLRFVAGESEISNLQDEHGIYETHVWFIVTRASETREGKLRAA
jgi:hypothetical protein